MALSLRSAVSRDLEMGDVSRRETVPLTEQPRQDDEHGERQPDDLERRVPLKAFFEQGLPHVLVIFPVIAKHWYNKDAGILSRLFSGISVACLLVSFVLHSAATIFTCYWIQKVTVQFRLAYLSVFLRIVASTLLLLFLDPVRHLVVTLPLSLLVLVLLGYLFWKTFISHKEPGKGWGGHEAELKVRFDLSSQVVTFAFAGLLGTVLGYAKEGSSNQQVPLSGRGYMAPDCFLLYSVVLGLLVQLFRTVPTYIYLQDTRRRMAKVYLRIVAYASLMFLVLAGVMAAEEILREWVFISCFIIVIIPVVCFWYEVEGLPYYPEPGETGTPSSSEEDDKAAQYVLAFFTSSFAALMASNAKYGIETAGTAVSLSGWFKFCVLSVLHGVLSYAVRMVFSSEMPEMKSSEFAKKVWTWSMLATVPITILLVARVGSMYPDEIKNIF